jgi:hypothetical protein
MAEVRARGELRKFFLWLDESRASRRGESSDEDKLDISSDDWFFARLLTHPRVHVTRHELTTQWCITEACQTHRWLDAIDDLAERQRRRAEAERET